MEQRILKSATDSKVGAIRVERRDKDLGERIVG
jgi:hypothetical protein